MHGRGTHQEESKALVDYFRRTDVAPGEPTPAPLADALGAALARLDAVEERLRDAESRLAALEGR
jgi:hypothetical protein